MSLNIPQSTQTDAEQRDILLKSLSERREAVAAEIQAAGFWARMKADPDFEAVLPKGLLKSLYEEVDKLIDTCELIDLPNVRAQRNMTRKLRERIETEMNNGVEKLESLRAELESIQKETEAVMAAPAQYQ